MLAIKLVAVFVAVVCALEEDSLAGEKVYRITPTKENEVHFLRKWLMDESMDIDVWTEPSAVGNNVDVRVPASLQPEFEQILKTQGFNYKLMIEDVELAVAAEEASNAPDNAFAGGFNYQKYNSYDSIIGEIRNLANQHSSASLFFVGKSYEGRTMTGIRIGDGSKKAIWIDGGIHAREWISPATVMWFLNKMLTSNEARVTNLLAKYDFYFLPVFNVDGYEYTRSGRPRARFWRKTRSRQAYGCIGADPNRNWDYKFGGVGTSSNPCADTYHGTRGFSEIEVRNVANYLKAMGSKLVSYFNVHAYSQMVLTPWGYTSTYPKDYALISKVARAFTQAVSRRYGTQYRYGPPPRLLYACTGGSMDWTYGALGVKYSYALELRDKGRYGFILPASQIAPSGEETSDAFIAAFEAM